MTTKEGTSIENPQDTWSGRFGQLGANAKRALESTTLPTHVYWSDAIYQAELEGIFFNQWICVGRIDEVPAVGNFFTRNIGTESVIVVRDSASSVRAHLNVCRHRACPLVEGRGTATAFKCPYHGWIYTLSGELRGAAEMQRTVGFDKKDYSLLQAQVELWHGFIFIHFGKAPAPLSTCVPGLQEWTSGFDLDSQVTIHEWEYRLDCNWKVYVENYVEEYHVPFVHRETLEPIMPLPGWHTFPEIAESWGMIWGDYPKLSWSSTGKPLLPLIKGLSERSQSGMPLFILYPMFLCMPAVDCTAYYLVFPTGPETSQVLLRLCVPKDTAEALKSDAELQAAAAEYCRNIETFVNEDNEIARKQQLGLRSRRAVPGRYSKREFLLFKYHDWLRQHVYSRSRSEERCDVTNVKEV